MLLFGSVSGRRFVSPRAPSEAETVDFVWSVVQNRRLAFLLLGAAWVDFGIENRPGQLPGAKRPTFDFEQPSTQNQWFQPRRVPGKTQNASRKRYQKTTRFFIDLDVKIAAQMDLEGHHFGTQNA